MSHVNEQIPVNEIENHSELMVDYDIVLVTDDNVEYFRQFPMAQSVTVGEEIDVVKGPDGEIMTARPLD